MAVAYTISCACTKSCLRFLHTHVSKLPPKSSSSITDSDFITPPIAFAHHVSPADLNKFKSAFPTIAHPPWPPLPPPFPHRKLLLCQELRQPAHHLPHCPLTQIDLLHIQPAPTRPPTQTLVHSKRNPTCPPPIPSPCSPACL